MVAVSILIPANNEEQSLGDTLREVHAVCHRMGCDYEVIVIDDGSTDGTASIANQPGTILLHHDTNRGYGAALKTGLRAAKGERIVIIDADGTYPADRIPELVAGLDQADMVVGARTGEKVHIPLVRRPAKWVINRLANRVASRKIPDLNSGLRAFRRELGMKYLHLYPDGFSLTTTLTLASICDGFEVRFVPVNYHRRAGQSKIHPLRDTFNFLVLIIRMAAYFEPLRVFLPATFLSGFFSVGLLGYYFYYDHGVSDTGVLACIVTLLIFMMGILADLVVRRTKI